ncbi:MAG: hypothetical protein HC921_19860 [Synechococcaceae cyanobacterium SM2_3_1]|nr:hypothetical protein [Synechococcaceae cyanobacterium SM2_3_1]
MILDPDTGELAWFSPVAGTYLVEILVRDSRGGSVTQTYQLVISDVEPDSISGSVYLDLDGNRVRKVSNPGDLTPATQPTVGADFARIYTAYPLGRPPGLPGIPGTVGFPVRGHAASRWICCQFQQGHLYR